MSCSSGCNYNLHMECFHLPPRLPSIRLHHQPGHDLILESSDKLGFDYCHVCAFTSSGLYYACIGCKFKADIKCTSLPDTIYHTAHPQHPLNLVSHNDVHQKQRHQYYCGANCGGRSSSFDCYACSSCEFIVHIRCAMLPASFTSCRWDKHHPLPLTYNANLNHPGEFYCDKCEREMNPKSWMYHCRHCDISFHPRCFKTRFGWYSNIRFGKEYVNAAAHPHPLVSQLLTTKRRCNLCRNDRYELPGFHCESCNFFICRDCGKKMIGDGDMKAAD
ncbi:protein VACUOLELESS GAMETOPHYTES-like [Salvia miltiorrhiza]|uniref:protein VACUOLELESS GAMETOPHYTES-like n=1 Tax=Salvia miltiorrhiza TaxID=226208 RepID=UPI0025AD939B|nr:protein VACUOLELESS GAMETOPHYTES-like [Salvia miltiorrhiza]